MEPITADFFTAPLSVAARKLTENGTGKTKPTLSPGDEFQFPATPITAGRTASRQVLKA